MVAPTIIPCALNQRLIIDNELEGKDFFLIQQSLAVLALIPIWLYKGKQGPHNKFLKYFYYWFYPAHMLVLALIKMYVI